MKSRFFLHFTGLAFFSLLLAGCSSGSGRPNMGTLWGDVTYQGKLVTGGTIHFIQEGNVKSSFSIRGDGSYSADVPLGLAKIAIVTESAQAIDREQMLKLMEEVVGPEVAQKKQKKVNLYVTPPPKVFYMKIPARYNDPDQSGLTHEVIAGEQERDFELP